MSRMHVPFIKPFFLDRFTSARNSPETMAGNSDSSLHTSATGFIALIRIFSRHRHAQQGTSEDGAEGTLGNLVYHGDVTFSVCDRIYIIATFTVKGKFGCFALARAAE